MSNEHDPREGFEQLTGLRIESLITGSAARCHRRVLGGRHRGAACDCIDSPAGAAALTNVTALDHVRNATVTATRERVLVSASYGLTAGMAAELDSWARQRGLEAITVPFDLSYWASSAPTVAIILGAPGFTLRWPGLRLVTMDEAGVSEYRFTGSTITAAGRRLVTAAGAWIGPAEGVDLEEGDDVPAVEGYPGEFTDRLLRDARAARDRRRDGAA